MGQSYVDVNEYLVKACAAEQLPERFLVCLASERKRAEIKSCEAFFYLIFRKCNIVIGGRLNQIIAWDTFSVKRYSTNTRSVFFRA